MLRRFPEHSLLKFCDEVKPSLVVGDENPMREPEGWRKIAAKKLKVPLWTVDADVIVPSKLLEKEQYAAHIIRPRLQAQLEKFMVPSKNPPAKVAWTMPIGLLSLDSSFDITQGWKLDTSASPVTGFRGGTTEATRLLKDFLRRGLSTYATKRNKPEVAGTSRLSPYLHFGHISPVTVALAAQKANVPNADKEAFLNQIITWRELAVNLVRFNPNMTISSVENRGHIAPLPPTPKTNAPCLTPNSNWSRPRPTTPCGMRPRPKWSTPAGCTTICACIGQKRSWNGALQRHRPSRLRCA